MKKLLPLLALILTGCQLGPFHYTLPEKTNQEGYHGAHGCAYKSGMDAALLARDLTDDELMEGADALPGNGYRDSQWCGENPTEVAVQEVFQDDDGEIFILTDEGDVINVVKLHLLHGKNGKLYIFDDEKDEMIEFDPSPAV